MNYIWELAIKAIQKGIDESDIFYTIGQPFSAYMELSMECMNEKDILKRVEINPYYRYLTYLNNYLSLISMKIGKQ